MLRSEYDANRALALMARKGYRGRVREWDKARRAERRRAWLGGFGLFAVAVAVLGFGLLAIM